MSDATLSPVSLIVNVFNHLNQLNFHFNSCNPNNSSADVDGFVPGTASRTDTPSHSIMILAHARESYSSASGKRTLDVGCKRPMSRSIFSAGLE
jgi:hypothetical protein